jgi:D-amino-acid oxidase
MRVTVLGSGIIGLWCSYELARLGCQVDVLSDASVLQTTSASAACVLVPMFPGDPTTDSFREWTQWSRETVEYIRSLPTEEPFLEAMPCYEFGRAGIVEYGFEVESLRYVDLLNADLIRLPTLTAGCDLAVRFGCLFLNTATFLTWMESRLLETGVRFRRKSIRDISELEEIESEVIFNCLGYNHVFPDPELYPVFGQSFFIPTSDLGRERFVIGAFEHAVFSHRRGLHIGAYFEVGETRRQPRDDLLKRSLQFLDGPFQSLCRAVGIGAPQISISHAEPVKPGLRPFRRSGPRVELERLRGKTVIHNYGHGAHGWTVGYGAARKAVQELLLG